MTAVDEASCRLEMHGRDAQWPVFGLGPVEAPFTIESSPPQVLDMMARWSGRFAAVAT